MLLLHNLPYEIPRGLVNLLQMIYSGSIYFLFVKQTTVCDSSTFTRASFHLSYSTQLAELGIFSKNLCLGCHQLENDLPHTLRLPLTSSILLFVK